MNKELLENHRLIDLTDEIYTGMSVYPDDPEVKVKQYLFLGKDTVNAFKLNLSTQSGTHLQSGFYVYNKGEKIDKINPKRFFGKCLIIDVPSREFGLEDITESEKKKLCNNEFVIFRSDYKKNITLDDMKSTERPIMKIQLAKYLVENGIKLIGTDTQCLGKYPDFPSDQILCKNNVMILEGLSNLETIRKKEFFLIVFPLKIRRTEGSPCRVVALEPKN